MALSYTFNGIGHLVTASSPNLDVALTLAGVVGGLSNNFSGFFIVRHLHSFESRLYV